MEHSPSWEADRFSASQEIPRILWNLKQQNSRDFSGHRILAGRPRRRWEDNINPYPTAFPYGNGMVLHFYQQQESSTTKTVHKVINKGLKTYV